jgi:hypothetical protein
LSIKIFKKIQILIWPIPINPWKSSHLHRNHMILFIFIDKSSPSAERGFQSFSSPKTGKIGGWKNIDHPCAVSGGNGISSIEQKLADEVRSLVKNHRR